MRTAFAIPCFVLACAFARAQNAPPKALTATRTAERISIDGVLDELVWSSAVPADGFVQNEPRPNEPATLQSQVRVIYDDAAMYVGATLSDPSVDSLLFQLSERDEFLNTDWFSVIIDPYRSGLNGFGFNVSSSNVQLDFIFSDDSEDETWNAVWQSAVGLTPAGWIVEMKIPYSAIRFPRGDVQEWNMNFVRHVGRKREKSFWSPIDPQRDGFLSQCGMCSGITAVKSPFRLMLYPYVSAYAQHFPQGDTDASDWSSSFNGGMDVKLGLSDAYTLDMTLIPDFGQVVSDNVVLNLSPFEVQYNENRQFFTEGTELFQRGGLFYSRRIGGEPLLRDALQEGLLPGEAVVGDPGVSKLLNATKVSGRNGSGLGFGLLNAITRSMYATVSDSLGNEHRVLTDPLTNYNVLVADQLLPNNGYVSIINTNVLRDGDVYDANATALDFRLNDRGRTVQGTGTARISQQFAPGPGRDPGYSYTAGLEKTGGAWTYGATYNEVSPDFDPNDLGFWQYTNYRGVEPVIEYNNYKPKGRWMRWGTAFNGEYLRVVQPDHFFNLAVEVNTYRITKKFNAFGGHVRAEPIETFDPFEPRVPGRLYRFPTNMEGRVWYSSNYSKPLALDADCRYRHFNESGRRTMSASLEPRFRPSDRLFFIISAEHSFNDQDIGWVAFQGDSIILGRRDLWTTEVGLEGRYIFNNRMSLSARARHYWSRAHYVGYHLLLENGDLGETDYAGLDENGSAIHDVDFDAFTVDLLFRWNFAPGSELTLGWKDNIFTQQNKITANYFDDLGNTLEAPGANSFSLKVFYFIDAQMFKRKP
ncbi:MAG: DUF5916 domain-containing protein [Flavobacteriales bacterium]